MTAEPRLLCVCGQGSTMKTLISVVGTAQCLLFSYHCCLLFIPDFSTQAPGPPSFRPLGLERCWLYLSSGISGWFPGLQMPWSHPGSIQRLHQCMHVLPRVPLLMPNKSRPAESQAGLSSLSAGRGREKTPAHTGESICNSTDTGSSMSPAWPGEGCTLILQTRRELPVFTQNFTVLQLVSDYPWSEDSKKYPRSS